MKPITTRVTAIEMQSIALQEKARALLRKGEDIIQLAANEMIGVTPAPVREAAKKALDDGQTGYDRLLGYLPLRERIAEKLKQDDSLVVDPETEIMVTVGAQAAIFLATQTVIGIGDNLVTTQPGYPFDRRVAFAGGTTTFVPLKREEGFRLDPDRIEKAVGEKTKMLALVNPHSPTGRVFTREELQGLAEIAQKHDFYVLTDQVFDSLVYDGKKHITLASLPGMKERTILTNSFSKSFRMSGWRIGYAVANRSLIEAMGRLYTIVAGVGGCATFAQVGAMDVYRWAREDATWKKRAQEARDFAVKRLNEMPKITCHLPEAGTTCFPNISAYGLPATEFAERILRDAKVAVAPGINYNVEGHVRINMTHPRMAEGLDRMEKALEKI